MLKEINITLIIIHSILCGHTIESTILNMLWQVELITMVYYLYGYNNKIKIINYCTDGGSLWCEEGDSEEKRPRAGLLLLHLGRTAQVSSQSL